MTDRPFFVSFILQCFVPYFRTVSRISQIMEYRMATEDLWDQSGYNLELMLNSHDAHLVAGASVRVMSPLGFLNRKARART